MDPATSARCSTPPCSRCPGGRALPLTVAAQAGPALGLSRRLRRRRGAGAAGLRPSSPAPPATEPVPGHRPGRRLRRPSSVAAGAPPALAGPVVFPVPADLAGTDRAQLGRHRRPLGLLAHRHRLLRALRHPRPGRPPPAPSQIDTTQAWAGPWLVKVSHGPGRLTTWYAHMQKLLVTDGQTVTAGQQIGEVGAEGNATGCHLHFEVHTARRLDLRPRQRRPLHLAGPPRRHTHRPSPPEPAPRERPGPTTRRPGRRAPSAPCRPLVT